MDSDNSAGEGLGQERELPVREVIELGDIESLEQSSSVWLRQSEDRVRTFLAVGYFVLLAVIVLFILLALWARPGDVSVEDLVLVANVAISPVVGLVGAATGFYFGAGRQYRG